MPSRYLKDAYIASERINAAQAEARDCWVRLLLVVDDYGRFYGDPQLVASRCYPLSPDAGKCERMLAELVRVRLIVLYRVAGKMYLQLTQWSERVRSKAKFPDPPEGWDMPVVNCAQLSADCEQPSASGEQLPAVAGNCKPHAHADASVPITGSITPSAGTKSRATTPQIFFDEDRGWLGVSDGDMAGWREAYPALDLPSQLFRAAEWVRSNPKNRKGNWRRFLTNWLGRAQDAAPRAPPGTTGGARRVAL